ncbi:hypothetical protein KR222_005819, partial [Zaprionus bogoriensis]
AVPIAPCDQLETYLSKEFFNLNHSALMKAVELLQLVIDSAKVMSPSESEQNVLESFAEFIARVKPTEDPDDILEMMEGLEELLSFDDSLESDESEDLIGKLLRQHGFEVLEEKLEKEVRASLKRIEAYLREHEHLYRDDPILVAKFTDFRMVTDVENKLLTLMQFV